MKNVLVTGATGFIGQHLIKELKTQIDMNIIVLGSKEVEGTVFINHNNYSYTSSVFLENGIDHVDIVIHLGAFTPKNTDSASHIESSISNINSTNHLINNLPNIPEIFIFTSTIDVYGETFAQIDENMITNPTTLYGHSKLFCENLLNEWAKKDNVSLQILRIGHIYGEGEEAYKKIIPITIQKILNGEAPIIFTDGIEKRAFLHIEDCCRLIIKSLELKDNFGPINLVSAHSYSIKEIVERIIKISNLELKVNILGEYMNARSIEFDNSKMVDLLGTEQILLDEGLCREFNYFKNIKL